MAQAFIDYVVKSNPHGNKRLEKQLHTIRNQIAVTCTEFSDCDENLLVQAADEIEQDYNSKSRKRKRKRYEDIERKRQKLEKNSFICDVCDKVYKHKRTLHRHLHSHFSTFRCEKCNKTYTRKTTLNRHKEKCEQLKKN